MSFLFQGIYDECLQFKYFMEDIHIEIQKDLEQLKFDKNVAGEDDEEEDRKKAKLMSKSSRMLQYIRKTNIEATFVNISMLFEFLKQLPYATLVVNERFLD